MSNARHIAHFFIPRASNNHRARILHFSSLLVLALSLLAFQFGIEKVSTTTSVLGYAAQISPEEVIRLTNVKRAENGLPPVTYNVSLTQAAQSKGAHMLSLGYWAHVAPDGTEPWKFFKDVNYKYRYAGENLARDFSNPSSAVDAWMASPTHRENMLSSKYKEIGIGVVEGNLNGVDTTIIVQLFGTPANENAPTVQVAANTAGMATSSPRAANQGLARVTPTATPIALAVATPLATPVLTLGQSEPVAPQVLISPFVTTRGISLIVIGILVFALVIDFIVVSQKRLQRISGRTWAHLSFLAMLLIIVVIVRAGKIM